MFSTDKQMGYQCFRSFFDSSGIQARIGAATLGHRTGVEVKGSCPEPRPDIKGPTQTAMSPT